MEEKGKKSATHFSEIIEWWGMKLDLSRYILRPVSGTKEAFHKYSLNEHKVHFPDFMLFIFCFKFCIYLFLAAQGLWCCARTFSSVTVRLVWLSLEQGLLCCSVRASWWFLLSWSTGFKSSEFSSCSSWAQYLWHTDLVAPLHVESSQKRDRTPVPCIGKQILIHCTTREIPFAGL